MLANCCNFFTICERDFLNNFRKRTWLAGWMKFGAAIRVDNSEEFVTSGPLFSENWATECSLARLEVRILDLEEI
jgi:hypothetical protein